MGGLAYGRGRVTVYYQCPHSPKNPRHAAASPGHPAPSKASGTRLDEIVALFFAGHVFGPGRAAQVPATDAAAPADRDARAAALAAKQRQLEAAQNAQILALEQLPAGPGGTSRHGAILADGRAEHGAGGAFTFTGPGFANPPCGRRR